MVFRYIETQIEKQELGASHLASVNAVLPSSIADARKFAVLLREEYHLKLLQRPESALILESAANPQSPL
ncbi:hypothetical protein ABG067_007641 [Albugo candida]